jgi:maltokinase
VTASLIDELRLQWPPLDPATTTGYLPIPLVGLALVDACELPARGEGRLAVGIAIDATGATGAATSAAADDRLVLVPLIEAAGRWRRARPGDGLSAALVAALASGREPGGSFVLRPLVEPPPAAAAGDLAPPERAVGVDQTNVSVVVGESVIVKWLQRPAPGGRRAATLLAHLQAVGYHGVPPPYGSLSWQAADGREATVALADGYLPDARDGWDWCVARLAAHLRHEDGACPPDCDPWIGGPLGRLVAGLHVALATPSDVIPEPLALATPEDVHAWRAAATATLEASLALHDADRGGELGTLASPIRNVLAALATDIGTAVQPVHGDLHVGQVLEWRGGLAIIDFDGNPMQGEGANALLQPAARDVAQMTTSLDHVGRVVADSVDGALVPRVNSWIADTTAAFIAAYIATLAGAGRAGLFDAALLAPFEVEQEIREIVYAARFLPRWRYAPMAALRARFRGR